MPPTPRCGASSRPHRSTQAAYPTLLSTHTTFNSAHPSTSAPRYRPTLVWSYGSTTDYPLATQDVVDQTRHEEALRKLWEVGRRGPDEVSRYIYPEDYETHLDVNLRRGLAQKITTECSELFYCSPCGKSVSLLDKRGAPQHFETKLHVMAVKRAAGLSGDAQLRFKYMILRPCPGLDPNCKQSHHRYDHPCIRGAADGREPAPESISIKLRDQMAEAHNGMQHGSAEATNIHSMPLRGCKPHPSSFSPSNTENKRSARIKHRHAANGPPPQTMLRADQRRTPQALLAIGMPQTMGEDDGLSSRHEVIADNNPSPVSASSSMGPITPPPLPYQDFAHMFAGTPYKQHLAVPQPSMSIAAQPQHLRDGAGPSATSPWDGSQYNHINGYSYGNYTRYETEEYLYGYGYQETPCVATATSIALAAMSAPSCDSPIKAMDAPFNSGAAAYSALETAAFDQLSILLAADHAYGAVPTSYFAPDQLELPVPTPEENLHFTGLLNLE